MVQYVNSINKAGENKIKIAYLGYNSKLREEIQVEFLCSLSRGHLKLVFKGIAVLELNKPRPSFIATQQEQTRMSWFKFLSCHFKLRSESPE